MREEDARKAAIRRQRMTEAQREAEAGLEAQGALKASGIEVGPQVKFQDLNVPPLPEVGTTPGGKEQKSARMSPLPRMDNPDAYHGEQQQSLDDDYAKEMSSAGLGNVMNTSQTQNRPSKEPTAVEHPLLKSLRNDFGIDQVPMEDVPINGHIWTLGVLDSRELQIAARFTDTIGNTLTERSLISEGALVALAVRAIDKVPVYEVFSVPIPPGTVVYNPLLPPREIRTKAAFSLLDFLLEDTKSGLIPALIQAYEDKLDKAAEVSSYLNDPENPRYRYKSPHADYQFVDFPRFGPDGEELPFYCKFSGKEMVKVSKVLGANDLPLP